MRRYGVNSQPYNFVVLSLIFCPHSLSLSTLCLFPFPICSPGHILPVFVRPSCLYPILSNFPCFLQNYQLYKIKSVDAGKTPILYALVDLMDAPIPGHYYREQLMKGQKPDNFNFFKMEKIVRKRQRKGKTEFLVKYTHYPHKFNRWVEEEDILK